MLGLIELLVVILAVLLWAVVELRGLRTDKRKTPSQDHDAGTPGPATNHLSDRSIEARHPEGQQGLDPGGPEPVEGEALVNGQRRVAVDVGGQQRS